MRASANRRRADDRTRLKTLTSLPAGGLPPLQAWCPVRHRRRAQLLVPPLAAVVSGVPVLLTRRISKLAVHVLGSTVSPARQGSCPETNQARESPDRQDHCGEEGEGLPPRHLDHPDLIWMTNSSFPAGRAETSRWQGSSPGAGIAGLAHPGRGELHAQAPLPDRRATTRAATSPATGPTPGISCWTTACLSPPTPGACPRTCTRSPRGQRTAPGHAIR